MPWEHSQGERARARKKVEREKEREGKRSEGQREHSPCSVRGLHPTPITPMEGSDTENNMPAVVSALAAR